MSTSDHAHRNIMGTEDETVARTSPYGVCPAQLEGTTSTGRPFYFRARHGEWHLWVGPHGAEPHYLAWCDDGQLAAHGEDPSDGYMPPHEVDQLVTLHVGPDWVRAG